MGLDQILAVVKTVKVLSWGVFPDRRTSLSVLVIYMYVFILQVFFAFCLFSKFLLLHHHHYLRPAIQVLYSRLCLMFIYCSRI
jgi:hypothetical protein